MGLLTYKTAAHPRFPVLGNTRPLSYTTPNCARPVFFKFHTCIPFRNHCMLGICLLKLSNLSRGTPRWGLEQRRIVILEPYEGLRLMVRVLAYHTYLTRTACRVSLIMRWYKQPDQSSGKLLHGVYRQAGEEGEAASFKLHEVQLELDEVRSALQVLSVPIPFRTLCSEIYMLLDGRPNAFA